MKRVTTLSPFLFALAPVLTLFASNAGQARVSEMLLPLAGTLLLTLLCLPLLAAVCRGFARASVALSIAWILFFSYGHLAALLGGFQLGPMSAANPKILLPVVAGLWLLCARAVRGTETPPYRLGAVLGVVGTTLVLTSLVSIASFLLTHQSAATQAELPPEEITAGRVTRKPDIYYIIFDRYTSAQVLSDRYGFDNSPLVDHLESRGFFVAPDSRANYLVTAQSLASSLNMAHITPLTDLVGKDSKDWLPAFQLLGKHRVGVFLKSQGYRYIHLGPVWNATASNALADENHQYRLLPEFTMIFIRTTAAYPLLYRAGVGRLDVEKFKRVNVQLALLQDLRKHEEGPIFVFAHILVPHGPFVFRADGSFQDTDAAATHTEHENYLGQIAFVNARIRELVDAILSHYPEGQQPVIVIQGDEGPYPARTQPHGFDWSQATDAELNEKMRILNAVYAPGCDGFYPSETPVNTFRIIFNCYFDTRLPLLTDRSYAYRDQAHLYDFIEVTDRLDAASR